MGTPEWVFPTDLAGALAALAEPGSMAVAGGTTVCDLLRLGHPEPRRLVDLHRLGLNRITAQAHTVALGALASNTQVANAPIVRARIPVLSQAIAAGASGQIRNMATVGGNLLQATRCVYFRNVGWACNRRSPGSGCPALRAAQASHAVLGASAHCIATHPSDMAVALLALDANVRILCASGATHVALEDFYCCPNDVSAREHTLPQGALITQVDVALPAAGVRSGYLKLRGRASYEFASASVAATLRLDRRRIQHVTVALGGLATKPWRRRDAEMLLLGKCLSAQHIDAFCDRLLANVRTAPETAHKPALARGAIHQLLLRLSTP